MPDFSHVLRDLRFSMMGICPVCEGKGWHIRGFWFWKKASQVCRRCKGTGRYSETNKESVKAYLEQKRSA